MVMTAEYKQLKTMEKEVLDNLDPAELALDNQDSSESVGEYLPHKDERFAGVLNCLPTVKDVNAPDYGMLTPEFRRYYQMPWGKPFFYDYHDPFNDLIIIIYGPRGGGKTITAVTMSIVDGMMKGIPTISNVPISFVAKDCNNKHYKVESIPFDIEKFAVGDPSLKYKRLLLDEGNYLADRLRSTSNKNMAMTDILQQARKFRMTIIFCTINYMWIDPRVTGSLCDVTMECKDFYYDRYYRAKYKLGKGEWIALNALDQSGKISGMQGYPLESATFNARKMWKVYDTENFVDPIQARKRLNGQEKTVIDENGQEISESEWKSLILAKVQKIPDGEYTSYEWWDMLGIGEIGLRNKVGRILGSVGIGKRKDSSGRSYYIKGEMAYA